VVLAYSISQPRFWLGLRKLKLHLDIPKRILNTADPSDRAVEGRLVSGIASLNPDRGMGVCLLCLYVVILCRWSRVSSGSI